MWKQWIGLSVSTCPKTPKYNLPWSSSPFSCDRLYRTTLHTGRSPSVAVLDYFSVTRTLRMLRISSSLKTNFRSRVNVVATLRWSLKP